MEGPAGQDRGSDAALQNLNSVLTADEKLEAWAMQRRIFALNHRRIALGATSGRFLAITRPLFGGFDLTDVRWQDLKEVHLSVGVLGATLRLTALVGTDLASAGGPTRTLLYEGLDKAQAQALYRICQAHDQAWREKRRVRDLEELRARSGGIQLSAGGAASAPAPAAAGAAAPAALHEADAASRLRNAKSMLDSGLITDSEYEALKARIISNV
jgi:putative oligomerization/nucleic acid binding protein